MDEIVNGSMNRELEEWIKENREISKVETKSSQFQSKPKGKCRICGQKDAKFVCIKCNKSVCSDCYFKIIGVCMKCIPENIVEKWKGKNPNWEKILGIKWMD